MDVRRRARQRPGGAVLARSGSIEAHRVNQTIWVLVNGALVLFIMASAMASFKLPNLKALTDVGNAITVLHAIFGVLTVAGGGWLVLQMNDVLPADVLIGVSGDREVGPERVGHP